MATGARAAALVAVAVVVGGGVLGAAAGRLQTILGPGMGQTIAGGVATSGGVDISQIASRAATEATVLGAAAVVMRNLAALSRALVRCLSV